MVWTAMEQLCRDVSYGARVAARNSGFTAAAVLTLALGIGAATAIFSVVDAIVFRPLPYADADRLVKIWGSSAADPIDNMSLADFNDSPSAARSSSRWPETMGRASKCSTMVSSHFVDGAFVTPQWLSTLGVRPVLGRGFLPEEFQPGRDGVVILTDASTGVGGLRRTSLLWGGR